MKDLLAIIAITGLMLTQTNAQTTYTADMENLSTGSVASASAIGDFYSYVNTANGADMDVVENGGNKKLSMAGNGIARIYNNDNAGFNVGFDLSFDFSIAQTGDATKGSRILVIRANLANGSSNYIVSEIAIGDRGLSASGNKLTYTDGSTSRLYGSGYLILNNTDYTMHVWSDYEDKPAGKYNITVTPTAGGNPVYEFIGINLILNGSSISEFSSILVGQYIGVESIEHTLDNVVFANAIPPMGTVIVIK